MSRDRFVTAEGEQTAAAGAEAEALVDQGAELVSGSRLRVVDTQTGQVGEIDPEDFRANRQRFRLQTAAEADTSRRQEALADRGVETAITSALDTVLLGGVSRIQQEAGVAGEGIEGLREFNEGAALAGDIAGATGLGLLTGGAFNGLRAAGLGGRLLAGLGEGVAGAGLETIGNLNREMALGDTELTAQELLGQIGMSMLFGGAIGGAAEGILGGVGALGRGLMRGGSRGAAATREAVGRMIQRTTGREAGPGVAEAFLRDAVDSGVRNLDDGTAGFLRQAASSTEDGRAIRQAIEAGDSLVDDTLRPLRRQLDDLEQVTETAVDFSKGSLKREQIRRLVDEGAIARAADDIPGMVQSVRALADDIAREGGLPGGTPLIRELRRLSDQAEARLGDALERGGRDAAADAFIALDQFKRGVGQQTAKVLRSRNAGLLGEAFEGVYERLRQGLEREDVWGKAAAGQREINGLWSQLISNSGKFGRTFQTDLGLSEGFSRLRGIDPKKLDGWLRRTGTAVSELDDEVMQRQLQLQRQLNDALERNFDLPDEVRRGIASSRQVADSVEGTLARVRQGLGARNQFKEAQEALSFQRGVFDDVGVSQFLPLGLSKPFETLRKLRSPDRAIRMMAAMERMRGTFRQRVDTAANEVIESAASATGRQQASSRAFAGSLGALSAVAIGERFDQTVETLEKTQDVGAFAEQLAARTQTVADAAPETATELMATAVRASQYLQSILPPTAMAPPGTLGQPEGSPSDRVPTYQQRDFLMAAQVAEDPLSVLDEAARGTLDRAHVEALQAVYPRLHQQFTQRIVEDVADREEPLPYHGRLRISLLVDAPTDPTLTGAYIARQQQGHRQEAAEAAQGPVVTPGNASPPDLSGMSSSPMQELATRRAS